MTIRSNVDDINHLFNTCVYEKTYKSKKMLITFSTKFCFISYLLNKVKIFISCIFKISIFQVLKFIFVDIDYVNRH